MLLASAQLVYCRLVMLDETVGIIRFLKGALARVQHLLGEVGILVHLDGGRATVFHHGGQHQLPLQLFSSWSFLNSAVVQPVVPAV